MIEHLTNIVRPQRKQGRRELPKDIVRNVEIEGVRSYRPLEILMTFFFEEASEPHGEEDLSWRPTRA